MIYKRCFFPILVLLSLFFILNSQYVTAGGWMACYPSCGDLPDPAVYFRKCTAVKPNLCSSDVVGFAQTAACNTLGCTSPISVLIDGEQLRVDQYIEKFSLQREIDVIAGSFNENLGVASVKIQHCAQVCLFCHAYRAFGKSGLKRCRSKWQAYFGVSKDKYALIT